MNELSKILEALLPFLAILNPFALCLYLAGVMEDLETREFVRVLAWSSIIALIVFWIFAFSGETLLIKILRVRPAALRIFGGVIFFVIGYNYATRGYRATEMLRGSLEQLPSEIALPYMIGAGTITQSIIIGKNNTLYESTIVIFLSILISFFVVISFKFIRDKLSSKKEGVFDRYVNILSRINGLIIGAISTDMVVSGSRKLWLAG